MKKAVIKQIGLVLLVAFSLFLRLYKISSLPPSLNWDEVSHGFNAFSVLETGKDEWGQSFPLIFRAYGDYKLPLYIYLTSLSIKFFGLNIFSVRLVSALAGTGLVLVSYLIALKITKSKSLSFFAAFLTAVSPWSLFVSRAGLEANLAAFLFALGVYFLINFLDKSDYKKLSYTAFFWGLSVYAYNSARVLVPLFVLFCLLLFIKTKVSFRHIKLGLIVLSIFSLPVIGQIFNKTGQARFNLVAINDEGAVAKIIEQRQNSKLGPFVTRLIHNRPVNFLHTAFKNYISNLSPRYLFLRGGSHYQFSMPDHELLYLVISPFLLFGLGRCLFSKEAKVKLLFFWFLAAFIPSAITKDAPHVLRSILILPAPMIISAYGVGGITERIKGRSLFKGQLLLWVLIFAVLVSFVHWWQDYFNIYPKAYSWAWQYGYKEAVLFMKENYQNYDKIFVTKRHGEPHEFVLFYFGWNPQDYQNDPLKKWDYHAGWYWVDGFDKFVFLNDWEVSVKAACPKAEKCLLVTSPGNHSNGWSKQSEVKFLDGKTAFEILEK